MKRLLLLTVLLGFSFQGFSQDNNKVKATEKVKDTSDVQEKWSASNGISMVLGQVTLFRI